MSWVFRTQARRSFKKRKNASQLSQKIVSHRPCRAPWPMSGFQVGYRVRVLRGRRFSDFKERRSDDIFLSGVTSNGFDTECTTVLWIVVAIIWNLYGFSFTVHLLKQSLFCMWVVYLKGMQRSDTLDSMLNPCSGDRLVLLQTRGLPLSVTPIPICTAKQWPLVSHCAKSSAT